MFTSLQGYEFYIFALCERNNKSTESDKAKSINEYFENSNNQPIMIIGISN